MAPRINLPPTTRVAIALTLSLSFIDGVLRYRAWAPSPSELTGEGEAGSSGGSQPYTIPWLTLVPAQSLFYPWTFVSTTYVEENIFTLLLALATLFYGGKYLERAWGSKEFGKFLLVSGALPNALVFVMNIIAFALTGHTSWGFSSISGTTSLQIATLVSLKQLIPEHTISLFSMNPLSVRVKYLPILFLIATCITATLLFPGSSDFFLAFTGFICSWTYLRFYKRTWPDLGNREEVGRGMKGDASETFSMAGFFPEPIAGVVHQIGEVVFGVLVKLGVCIRFSEREVAQSNALATSRADSAGAPGPSLGGGRSGARAEAERRRALALKALDQRLHAATSKGPPARAVSPTPPSAPGGGGVQPTTATTASAGPGGVLGETTFTPDDERGKPGS